MTNKKIVFLTGTRAEFGKLQPLIDKIEKSNFECYIFVTGMHTLARYDFTYKEVLKKGYKNIFVYMNQSQTTRQDIILSNTIIGLSNLIKEINADMIVIHGDRLEALAGAIVGTFNNILVCHIEGGELTGSIDEMVRHSITKLSHIHMVSNENAKKRLIQMGEDKKCIFPIGSPDIDIALGKNLPSKKDLFKRYEIPFNNYAILIFHPVTTSLNTLVFEINELLTAVIKSAKNYVAIYPNNDPSSEIILKAYDTLRNNKHFRIFPSLRFEYFLSLLKNSEFIIGNSSAGITEAEVYGIPSINVGTRQQNRSFSKNIVNVSCDSEKILNAIKEISKKKVKKAFTFGDGKSALRFFSVINNPKTWRIPIQKQFVDRTTKP